MDYPIDHSDIDIDDFWYSNRLDQYQRLIFTIEKHLVSSCKKIDAEVRDLNKRLEAHEKKHGSIKDYENSYFFHLFDGLVADSGLYSTEFPNLVRCGLFLSIYGYLEHSLNSLCKQCQLDHDISVSDLRGSGLERAARYFRKAYGIKVPESVLRGAEFSLIQMIRNSLVHASGEIPVELEKRFNNLSRECLLEREAELQENGHVFLNANFLPWFIDRSREMFKGLCDELKAYLRSRSEQEE